MQLNKQDILKMACSTSPRDKADLAKSVSDICLNNFNQLNDHERSLFTEIMTNLLDSATIELKKNLASELSCKKGAPHALMEALANDEFPVAEIVLSKYEALNDNALINIVKHRAIQYKMSVACRKNLSYQVSDVIVEQGSKTLITELLKNTSAKISQATLGYLVDQSKKVNEYSVPLLNRDDLLPQHAAIMYQWVSETLRESICKKFAVNDNEIESLLSNVVSQQMKRLIAAQKTNTQDELVLLLEKENHLSTEFMIRCLKEGEIELFEAILAHKFGVLSSHLPPQILHDETLLALACRGIELSLDDYIEIISILKKIHHKVFSAPDARKYRTQYLKINHSSAKRTIKTWQTRVTTEIGENE